jgi:hypothetical protein
MSKSLKDKVASLHPSRTVDKNWQRRGSSTLLKSIERPRCALFSDGKHRWAVSPAGVRTACLCGERP